MKRSAPGTLTTSLVMIALAAVVLAQPRDPTKLPVAVSFADYAFPGLLTAVYNFELKRINDEPRVRGYYVAMFRAFNQQCGEAPPAETQYMMEYAFPEVREMKRNPGRGLATAAERLLGRSPSRGDLVAEQLTEGTDDALLFSKRYGCQTPAFLHMRQNLYGVFQRSYQSSPTGPRDDIRLFALMSPAHRRKLGIPDPPRPAVHWWTPLLGRWKGTLQTSYGPRNLTVELIDPLDPAMKGVFSEFSYEMMDPDGKPSLTSTGKVMMTQGELPFVVTSSRHGTVHFPGRSRSPRASVEAAVSDDGATLTGFLLRQVPGAGSPLLKDAFTVRKEK
jgi:hypothetical protein